MVLIFNTQSTQGFTLSPHRSYRDIIVLLFFFFNDPATTEIYPLPLHDALPISVVRRRPPKPPQLFQNSIDNRIATTPTDRKSTRLNSSHGYISYAVSSLKKKMRTRLTRAGGVTRASVRRATARRPPAALVAGTALLAVPCSFEGPARRILIFFFYKAQAAHRHLPLPPPRPSP